MRRSRLTILKTGADAQLRLQLKSVFPNPGEPQIKTSLVDSEVTWQMISSHSLFRPVKCGAIGGRDAGFRDRLVPLKK